MKTLATVADRREIFDRIAQLSDGDQRKWGKMSAHQMLCHLRDSYCLALGEKTASSATGFLQQTVIKWVALQAPLTWMKGVPTRPEMEQGRGGSAPVEFQSDKNALTAVLSRFCEELTEPCSSHPVFGPMKRHEWWRWGYLHADHHLRQF